MLRSEPGHSWSQGSRRTKHLEPGILEPGISELGIQELGIRDRVSRTLRRSALGFELRNLLCHGRHCVEEVGH